MSEVLGDLGEDELVQRLVKLVPVGEGVAEGPGDDCAVVDEGGGDFVQLLKTDGLVEGVHYERGAAARAVGWKAVARVISDFAAMGGRPDRFLMTVALGRATRVDWVEEFYRGAGDCLQKYGGVVAGGEMCRVPDGCAGVISVAATGRVRRGEVVLRSGGRVGDELWVTGRLGGSLAGKHLSFTPRVEEGEWLARYGGVVAMMDLSDGLGSDLPRMARASGCGFEIWRERVPVTEGCDVEGALRDGEDFELLVAVREGSGVLEKWRERFPELELTCVGRLVEEGAGESLGGGWDHFGRV